MILVFVAVVFLDVILSGDNALVIGAAANTLPKTERNIAIVFGMVLAAATRILLSLFAVSLLHYRLVGFVAGLTLMFVDGILLKGIVENNLQAKEPKQGKTFWNTIGIIALSDISMSLDNILAVAGVARNHPVIMSLGLICSIAFVGFGAKLASSLLEKWKFLNWVAFVLILFVALELIWS